MKRKILNYNEQVFKIGLYTIYTAPHGQTYGNIYFQLFYFTNFQWTSEILPQINLKQYFSFLLFAYSLLSSVSFFTPGNTGSMAPAQKCGIDLSQCLIKISR